MRKPHSKFRRAALVLIAAAAALQAGCVTYLTPGEGAPMHALADSAEAASSRIPEAQFPATLAVVRVQAADYRSFGAEGVGNGNYSVVYMREVEKPADFDAINGWPQVLGVIPLSQLTLPASLNSFNDLLAAAGRMQSDILLAYTFDTRFHIENETFAPEQKITLGVLPGRQARVTCTASALFADVRDGYIYGLAEGTASQYSSMTKWTRPADADATRLEVERAAFEMMMRDAKHTWSRIVGQYGLPMAEPSPNYLSAPGATPAAMTARQQP